MIRPGGRVKGQNPRASANKAAAVARSGVTPLDFMLKVMRNEREPTSLRLEAAKSAAPYVHAKLTSVDLTSKGGVVIVIKGGLPDSDE